MAGIDTGAQITGDPTGWCGMPPRPRSNTASTASATYAVDNDKTRGHPSRVDPAALPAFLGQRAARKITSVATEGAKAGGGAPTVRDRAR